MGEAKVRRAAMDNLRGEPLERVGRAITAALRAETGTDAMFSLFVWREGLCNYIATAEREDIIPVLEGMIARWRAGAPDFEPDGDATPAHKRLRRDFSALAAGHSVIDAVAALQTCMANCICDFSENAQVAIEGLRASIGDMERVVHAREAAGSLGVRLDGHVINRPAEGTA